MTLQWTRLKVRGEPTSRVAPLVVSPVGLILPESPPSAYDQLAYFFGFSKLKSYLELILNLNLKK